MGIVAAVFVLLVAGFTWYLLSQSRESRDYAQAALRAAAGQTLPKDGRPCAELLGQPLPGSIESCRVLPGTPPTAELGLQGGRKGVLRGE